MASVCCTLPLLLLAIGVGLTSAGFGFFRYAPLVGLGVMIGILYREVRRRNGGRLTPRALWRNRRPVVGALFAFGVAWYVVSVILTPLLGEAIAGRAGADPGALERMAGSSSASETGEFPRLELRIDGMYCPACLYTVKARLSKLPGVADVDVRFGGATLTYDPDLIDREQIRDAASFYVYTATVVEDVGGE